MNEILNSIRMLAEEAVEQRDAYFYAIDNVGFTSFDDAAEHAARLFYQAIRLVYQDQLN